MKPGEGFFLPLDSSPLAGGANIWMCGGFPHTSRASPPKPASQLRLGSTPMQEEPALMDLVFRHRRF